MRAETSFPKKWRYYYRRNIREAMKKVYLPTMDTCPTCSSPVTIEGSTTKHYVPLLERALEAIETHREFEALIRKKPNLETKHPIWERMGDAQEVYADLKDAMKGK
jgi:hypothetical protein